MLRVEQAIAHIYRQECVSRPEVIHAPRHFTCSKLTAMGLLDSAQPWPSFASPYVGHGQVGRGGIAALRPVAVRNGCRRMAEPASAPGVGRM
jgi:hypothetical protein